MAVRRDDHKSLPLRQLRLEEEEITATLEAFVQSKNASLEDLESARSARAEK